MRNWHSSPTTAAHLVIDNVSIRHVRVILFYFISFALRCAKSPPLLRPILLPTPLPTSNASVIINQGQQNPTIIALLRWR